MVCAMPVMPLTMRLMPERERRLLLRCYAATRYEMLMLAAPMRRYEMIAATMRRAAALCRVCRSSPLRHFHSFTFRY